MFKKKESLRELRRLSGRRQLKKAGKMLYIESFYFSVSLKTIFPENVAKLLKMLKFCVVRRLF